MNDKPSLSPHIVSVAANNPVFLILAGGLAFTAAAAWIAAIVISVWRPDMVDISGPGFGWLTVVGAPSFTALTGVGVARAIKSAEKTADDTKNDNSV